MLEVEDLKSISIELYPFAYCLLPDEFMAEQLIVDSLTRAVTLVEDVEQMSFSDELTDLLYRSLYVLAVERSHHFIPREKDPFYRELSLRTRSVLYLHYKAEWAFERIAKMMDCSVNDVMVALEEGRGVMKEKSYDDERFNLPI